MTNYRHEPKMIIAIARPYAPFQGFMMVDPTDRPLENMTHFWNNATNSTTGNIYANRGTVSTRRAYSSAVTPRVMNPQDVSVYTHGAKEGATTAIKFAHPNFPLRAIEAHERPDWWLNLVEVDILTTPDQQALCISRTVAEAILMVRTFYRAEEILPHRIVAEPIPADMWRPNTNLVAVWVPMVTNRDMPMAEPCLARLEPSLLVQVINHFVRERLRIIGGVEYQQFTLATNSIGIESRIPDARNEHQRRRMHDTFKISGTAKQNMSAGYASDMHAKSRAQLVASSCIKCLPDVTLSEPWTKDSVTALAPKYRRHQQRDELTEELPTHLPKSTREFAQRLHNAGREVPAWAQAAPTSVHAQVLPHPSTYVTQNADMDTSMDEDNDTMRLLGF